MYLDSKNKTECFGCENCVQVCGKKALSMVEDEEGFRYPVINESLCVNCSLCRKVCPFESMPGREICRYAFGGYNTDERTRFESTSGGAFSAIVEAFCDENYVIFGAESNKLNVFHSYITDKKEIYKFRKSKYSQSVMGDMYIKAGNFLKEGKKVLFSGTPCHIAALRNYLKNTDTSKLLTVEVVCEGVPSPLYIRKMDDYIEKKYGGRIEDLDYRYTGKSIFSNGKWDFQNMKIRIGSDTPREKTKDRWFNPFWSVWLNHLMSRPSCYKCLFATKERVADITLGDLWGVHLYCPELYGKNGGSSLAVCNTEKGKEVFHIAEKYMFGHELEFSDALKYQSPMRKTIDENPRRSEFMTDLQSDMSYGEINEKWAKKPTIKLLYQKYIWGNRQKIFFWNIKRSLLGEKRKNENA